MEASELGRSIYKYALIGLIVGIVFLVQFFTIDFSTEHPIGKQQSNNYHLGYNKPTSHELVAESRFLRKIDSINERISYLEKINFDKLGPADFAARMFGGEVISVVSTQRKESSFLDKIQNVFSTLYENDDQKQCVIQDCGICTALPGATGYIVLKLMGNVFLDAITIEHIPLQSSLSKLKSNSAVKEFSVVGMKELGDARSEVNFGKFVFNYEADFLETFTLKSGRTIPSVRYVRVEIHSNHGETYTCVYRLRIHGTLDQ